MTGMKEEIDLDAERKFFSLFDNEDKSAQAQIDRITHHHGTQLIAEIERLRAEVERLRGEWIPATEQLPEPDVALGLEHLSIDVLCVENGERYVSFYAFDVKRWVGDGERCNPTHWHYLPAPPTQEKEA